MRSGDHTERAGAAWARRAIITEVLLGVDGVPVGRSGRESAPDRTPAADDASERPAAPGAEDRPGGKAAALAALRARYEAESPLVRSMPGWRNIVFGDGDPDARLMFVGEAPGADEDAQGVPFVGRAGQKLNEMIRAMGLAREAVYIGNILKVRPPNNRTPTAEEAGQDGPFLIEQIRIIRPEVIVTLGKPAAAFLLNSTEAMGRLRGRWHDFEGVPVMPTYHPAYLLRSYTPENRRKVWSDLQQVMERLGLGG